MNPLLKKVPIPKPKNSEVLVRVKASGICHSDLHLWEGGYSGAGGKFMKVKNRGVKFPLTPGHEISGVIEDIEKWKEVKIFLGNRKIITKCFY